MWNKAKDERKVILIKWIGGELCCHAKIFQFTQLLKSEFRQFYGIKEAVRIANEMQRERHRLRWINALLAEKSARVTNKIEPHHLNNHFIIRDDVFAFQAIDRVCLHSSPHSCCENSVVNGKTHCNKFSINKNRRI